MDQPASTITATTAGARESEKPRLRLVFLLPVLIFASLAVLFFIRLYSGDPSRIPSALIGRPAPEFTLPPLAELKTDGQPVPGLSSADLKGKVTVINLWASWCAPCRQEHPLLIELGKEPAIRVVGINYKDTAENARRFLGALGNPYAAVGVDQSGRTAIDWGVYGVPETFVVARDGTIAYKLVGEITSQNIEAVLKPEIQKALKAGS